MLPRETSNPGQRARIEPLFDVHPRTGASVKVFYADRTLETFGRLGGWLVLVVSPARLSASRPSVGPFPTGYGAYRHAINTAAPFSLTMREGDHT